MIEYIKGDIASLTPTEAVIETTGGVGYLLNISLNTYTSIEQSSRKALRIYVHEIIREDAVTLYGFFDLQEREIFRQLIGVSGVGASIARMILSAIPPVDLQQVIVSSDVRRLKSVKGIGAKTAERIIVDLKDKIKGVDVTLLEKTPVASEIFDEAMAALVMLGFPKQQTQKVLEKIFKAEPDIKVEVAIKKALSMM
ncbi:MAG: Holliday junction branch migration protein RuvA [Bacteroidales bacterium]|nr:Holliday junction branch migration protein RuvA [Bacteroidales bacterium]